MILAIEGINGSGKTTVAKELSRITNSSYVRFPGYTTLGAELRHLIDKYDDCSSMAKLYMFLADMEETFSKLRNKEGGAITDRSSLSTIVYQTYFEGVDRELLLSLTGKYVFDRTVLLTVDPSVAISRLKHRGIPTLGRYRYTDESVLSDIQSLYMMNRPNNTLVINTTNKTINEVVEEVLNEVFQHHTGPQDVRHDKEGFASEQGYHLSWSLSK